MVLAVCHSLPPSGASFKFSYNLSTFYSASVVYGTIKSTIVVLAPTQRPAASVFRLVTLSYSQGGAKQWNETVIFR